MPTELLFRAFADSTRQRLLRVLCGEEFSVSDLVEILDQPQSTISRHLKVLKEAELVSDRRTGTTTLYAAGIAEAPEHGQPADASNGAAAIRLKLIEWVVSLPLDAEVNDRRRRVLRRRNATGAGFFDKVGGRWDQLRINAFGDVFHYEALSLLVPPHWTVADIGTGTGYLLPLLADRFQTVIAVEPAGAMLEAAKARPELQAMANITFREGSLDRLPLHDGEVDLAIASLVLHHVGEPHGALRELRRCVRAGGRLLVIEQEDHDSEPFHERMADHWWGFQPAILARWAEQVGFVEARATRLTSARPRSRTGSDAPPLFALTATAPA